MPVAIRAALLPEFDRYTTKRPYQEDKSTKRKWGKHGPEYQEVLSSGLEEVPPSFTLPFILLWWFEVCVCILF